MKQGFTPKYAHVQVSQTSHASNILQRKMQLSRIKEELKFLYKKKDTLNESLYRTHLQAAQEWGKNWDLIRDRIQKEIDLETEKKKYKKWDPNTFIAFFDTVVRRSDDDRISRSKHVASRTINNNKNVCA